MFLGKTAYKNQLWGKAKAYLESRIQSSLTEPISAPSILPAGASPSRLIAMMVNQK